MTAARARLEKASESGRREHAYRVLRDRIVRGTFPPNERLREHDLAREIGVSRQTIAIAMVRLEHDGLIVTQANKGATVRSVSMDEAIRMTRVREALEGLTAALAAESATDAQLGVMRDLVTEMRQLQGVDTLARFRELSNLLHQVISESAGDDVVEHMLASLNYALLRYEYRVLLLGDRREQSLAEHSAVVEALTARDPIAAERAMRAHIVAIGETLARGRQVLA
jgi:DNA-binding GntR family transcriptional regulator